jgi:predicted 3-demethylubiquinone-9 3-methyltransferase (glyoxalase superfamily)
MQTITPFLWFNDNAEEAMNFYCSIFKNSKATNVMRMGDGKVMTATFQLNGQDFFALNGGPAHFGFTEAVSFLINCDTQQEVDDLWEKLSDGGSKGRCGWLKDKYGLSWQVVPKILSTLLQNPDPEKKNRVMKTLMQMDKLDGNALQAASEAK